MTELTVQIRQDLLQHYPLLHLMPNVSGILIRGTFPVRDTAGKELDRYVISIELDDHFPLSLPIVREIGGRIPSPSPTHHMNGDGTACVLMPDDRWRCFPESAPFLQYLQVPLHNFFLGQSLIARGLPWPFKEWPHGTDGIYAYYADLLEIFDRAKIRAVVRILAEPQLPEGWPCPCGRGRCIGSCCRSGLEDLRAKITPFTASRTLQQFAPDEVAAKRSKPVSVIAKPIDLAGPPLIQTNQLIGSHVHPHDPTGAIRARVSL